MPTTLARLLGRGRSRKGGHHAYGLRLVAALADTDQPLRVLATACRLARRVAGCRLALVGIWDDAAPVPRLTLVPDHADRGDLRLLQEALNGRHSFLPLLDRQPLWLRLDDDQFQPGAPLLRRFDLKWCLALPFGAPLEGVVRRCVILLAGDDSSTDQDHPLIREARLIWLAARVRLAGDGWGTTQVPDLPWPGAEAWDRAPAALALVEPDRVVAVNSAACELLAGCVGRDGQDWEPWLLGAVQRLLSTGLSSEVVTASQSRNRSLAVTLGETVGGNTRLVALHEANVGADRCREQDAVMRVLGHELRTPLAAMQTSLDLVLRGEAGPLKAEQERFLGMARRNLERLNRLLGDWLDAKRAEAGRLAIQAETVDLGALLNAELAMLQVVCREKGVELDTSGVPATFRACVDADKIQQMLHNVVGNAIKYTGQGGLVRVWLQDRLETAPGTGVRLARRFELPLDVFTIVVEDNGLGMSEEFLEILFQPFSREDRVETRGLPGAGLGLHITRGLVEAHGGLIRLESEPRRGTTVWLVLPREPGSGNVLMAGRQLDLLSERAAAAGIPTTAAWLDVRGRVRQAQPWEIETAAAEVRSFLAGLGRDRRRDEVRRFMAAAGPLCWQLAPGLWCGLVLDVDRLEPAWQVNIAAPESSYLLTGTRWSVLSPPVAPPIASPQQPADAGPAALVG